VLRDIEARLLQHAQAEKRRWQEIAQLLMRVDQERLWEGHAGSFSVWLQGLARRADLQESIFWRCLKAGRIYVELTGRGELDLPPHVSAESLELADKISRHAPQRITHEIVERTLDGELSRAELRDVWATYRPAAGGSTARGRLPDEPDARAEALAARKAAWESEKRKPENRSEVRKAEMLASFRAANWLDGINQARAETRTAGLNGHLAAVLAVRRVGEAREERLELHGLWTCVSEPDLADYDFSGTPGTEFLWLAVPAELAPHALRQAPRLLGVLELTRERSLRMVRVAQRRPVSTQSRLEILSGLLQRAYLWP
jgi:hypothetical protein